MGGRSGLGLQGDMFACILPPTRRASVSSPAGSVSEDQPGEIGLYQLGAQIFHYDRAVSDDGLAGLASCSVSLTMVALGLVRGDDLN